MRMCVSQTLDSLTGSFFHTKVSALRIIYYKGTTRTYIHVIWTKHVEAMQKGRSLALAYQSGGY